MLQSTGNPADSAAYPNADESTLIIKQYWELTWLEFRFEWSPISP